MGGLLADQAAAREEGGGGGGARDARGGVVAGLCQRLSGKDSYAARKSRIRLQPTGRGSGEIALQFNIYLVETRVAEVYTKVDTDILFEI